MIQLLMARLSVIRLREPVTGSSFRSFPIPGGCISARMSLALSEPGTAWYNGMLMMEVIEGYSSSMFFDQREADKLQELTVWPVNPVVKVFHEDLPPITASNL